METIAYIRMNNYFDLQRRFLLEGYQVKLWFSSDVYLEDGADFEYRNLKVCNGKVEDCLKDSDLIIIDGTEPRYIINKVLAYVKKYNTPVYGLSPDSFYDLEHNREEGQELAQSLGYEPVNTRVFTEKDALLTYIKYNPDIVLKTKDGFYSTFVPTNKYEAQYIIEHDILQAFSEKKEIFVQPIIEGIEFNTAYYFNGKNFIPYVFITQEYKGAITNNIGSILTGEVGTVAKMIPASKLKPRFLKIMKDLEGYIQQLPDSKYFRGLFDVNQILTKDNKLYFLEFTPRIGIPSPEYEINFIMGSFPEFVKYVISQSQEKLSFSEDTFVFGSVYSYGCPFVEPFVEKQGVVFTGNLDNKKDIALLTGREYANNPLIKHNYNDRIALTYGKGSNIKQASADYVKRITQFKGFNVIYRTDIGYKWDEDIINTKVIERVRNCYQ